MRTGLVGCRFWWTIDLENAGAVREKIGACEAEEVGHRKVSFELYWMVVFSLSYSSDAMAACIGVPGTELWPERQTDAIAAPEG